MKINKEFYEKVLEDYNKEIYNIPNCLKIYI